MTYLFKRRLSAVEMKIVGSKLAGTNYTIRWPSESIVEVAFGNHADEKKHQGSVHVILETFNQSLEGGLK